MYIIKECTKCKEHKLLEDFNRRIDRPFGVRSDCKACSKKTREVYREKNKDVIEIGRRKYYEKNKERIKERIKKNIKQRIQTDPLFKMRYNIRTLIYMSIKNKGYTKNSRTFDILGCDYNTFIKHIERQFTKGMTWNNHGEWHYDHIIPISSAQTEEEVIKLNHYTNFQLLWAEDNLRKSNKIEPTQIKLRI